MVTMKMCSRKSVEGFGMPLVCLFIVSAIKISTALDSLVPGQSITDGGHTLVSADGNFELGFFSPGGEKLRYLGIRYKKISDGTVAWVANRETPITDRSGNLSINHKGVLVLVNGTNSLFWSSNTSRTTKNPVARLLGSGNFIVADGNDNNPDNSLWQSFDYPCDRLLPSMKLGINKVTGFRRFISSWKSTDNPARGEFTYGIDPEGYPQLVLKKGSAVQFRAGPWNGLRWGGIPTFKQNQVFRYEYVSNENELYYKYELQNSSVVSTLLLSQTGIVQRFTWIEQTHNWYLFFQVPSTQCDAYALCGPNGVCSMNRSPVCACLDGFEPKRPDVWSVNWLDGCARSTQIDCQNGEGFWRQKGMKLPDTSSSWVNESISLSECEKLCLRNCSCTAYANSDIRDGGKGCLLWFNDLIDMQEFSEGGQDLYIRMAASEIARDKAKRLAEQKKKVTIIVTCVLLAVAMLLLVLLLLLYARKRKIQRHREVVTEQEDKMEYEEDGDGNNDMELLVFDLDTITNATDKFSSNNKLGEGGFGPVYKGTLINGQEIAVKRLSRTSGQGRKEFKNEVILIANLQHRNLVKLLGCCIQGDEKMLIYEYMHNKSLDSHIFDEKKSKLLDWTKRFDIIIGIARGLLYLHQDSRLRIIHRDLKASNVLLDIDMNPKISDFGLAKIFGKDQSVANTNRVVGTFGYMAPEYAVDGLFSIKSDIFSFGVLVLEIVSGRKNRGFRHSDHGHNLVGHAWRLWTEGRPLELIDKVLNNFCDQAQVLRCIHVGLLCVQTLPEDRPSMSTVVLMLGSESSLPQPKQPGFYTERNPLEVETSSSKDTTFSRNEITASLLEPR